MRLMKFLRICFLSSLVLFCSNKSLAEQKDDVDGMALSMLESFLANSVEMEAYAKAHPEAKQANEQLKVFPEWAQKEITNIVMMIMREKKAQASRHVTAYQKEGAEAAYQDFSPAVKKAIADLAKKLGSDASFNVNSGADKILGKPNGALTR